MKTIGRCSWISRLAAGSALSLVFWRPTPLLADSALDASIDAAIVFAGAQLEILANDVLGYDNSVFTDYTDESGVWITEGKDRTVWTSGMVAGLFWYMYEVTGVAKWETYAVHFTDGISGDELEDDNDVGFQVFNSFGLGYRLVGTPEYKDKVLTGADTLYDIRFQDNIGAYWSWNSPSRRPEWERAVNVDMLLNLEIGLWASANGGNPIYYDASISHADVTWRDIVRPEDYSTFHVADYDPDTGALLDKGTYQGWQDDSTWSRGQAWAVYGYGMIYRYTKLDIYLTYCKNVLSYFLDNLPADQIPYADFDAPQDSTNSKDTSATAIVASAMLDLYELTDDVEYLDLAMSLLSALFAAPYYADDGSGYQSLLRAGCARWSEPEVGTITGDYFFMETMVRYKRIAPVVLLRSMGPVAVSTGTPSRRNLQDLGTFCAVEVVDGSLQFSDSDCEPVPPGSTGVGNDDTILLTPSPSMVGDDDTVLKTPAPLVGTPSPSLLGTPSPSSVIVTGSPSMTSPAPTALGGTPSPSSASTSSGTIVLPAVASFGAASLGDSTLSGMNIGETIVVRLSVDLDDALSYPSLLEITMASGTGSIVAPIPEPSGGWVVGTNTVKFDVPDTGVTGDPSTWSSVEEVDIVMDGSGSSNLVTVNWLVLGNALIL